MEQLIDRRSTREHPLIFNGCPFRPGPCRLYFALTCIINLANADDFLPKGHLHLLRFSLDTAITIMIWLFLDLLILTFLTTTVRHE